MQSTLPLPLPLQHGYRPCPRGQVNHGERNLLMALLGSLVVRRIAYFTQEILNAAGKTRSGTKCVKGDSAGKWGGGVFQASG